MKIILLTTALIFFAGTSYGSDLGYGRTQSSTSVSHRFKGSYTFNSANKISLTYRSSYNTSGVEDPNSSTLKFAYRYRTEGRSSYTFELKKNDELYFYESTAFALRGAWPLTSSTRLTFAGEAGQKVYSLNKNEKINQRTLTAGLDQELFDFITVGVEMSSSQFLSTTPESSKALAGTTITTTNISSYVDYLYNNSSVLFVELNFESWVLGASYASDTALLTSTKVNTTEIYADLTLYDAWSLGLFFSQGKTDGSTTTSETSGLSLSYRF